MGTPKKGPREKDLTSRYMSGGLDEDRVDSEERFSSKNKRMQQEKTARTAVMRAGEESGADIETLPIGQVIQVHSLFSDVAHEGTTYLCVVRKTLAKNRETQIVVGDRVRFRPAESLEPFVEKLPTDLPILRRNMPTAVLEKVLPRDTVLTRADSFKAIEQHPIVANAAQMLIVASLRLPSIKWGLIDRMLIAAQSGGLRPILCLNKIDLAEETALTTEPVDLEPKEAGSAPVATAPAIPKYLAEARAAAEHYQSTGITVLYTSASTGAGVEALRALLEKQETVLAGHSGVGKSSLINAIQPSLHLRTAEISRFNDKGRHTTTSARRYPLETGGAVIDTPGVKLFGLWGVTPENLITFFPDIPNNTAPTWRQESYERIKASIGTRN